MFEIYFIELLIARTNHSFAIQSSKKKTNQKFVIV